MKYDHALLNNVNTPARYLPLEMFAYRKPMGEARLTVALAFPDVYEVGMSHLGVRILYHLLNEREGIACDRVYAPWPDMEEELRKRERPLTGHESGMPLRDFDILGFSLAYELSYTNVLNMLDLGGIPVLAAERGKGKFPVVIGGGPCTSNPEPVADFFDAFLFGDGEEALVEICAVVEKAKGEGASREETLDRLTAIEGVYVPSLFEPVYAPDGRIETVKPKKSGYAKVRRRLVTDLEQTFFPDRPLVPVLEPVHDRVTIEVARGCVRGCRFCHAGMIYRPYRERSAERVLDLARKSLLSTGYEEISLLSLSAGDYSCINEVLISLIREHYPRRVSVSLPSLRVQGLSERMLSAIQAVRKTGFTVAPEAGTERLRRVINKNYSEDELIETARMVFDHGWRNLKLYFMIGLPTETSEDLAGIVRMGETIARMKGAKGRPQVTVSVSGFCPKSHTPFQWEIQASEEYLRGAIGDLKHSFSGKGRQLKWHSPVMTVLEGVMSRGDRRVGKAILAAFRRGLRFDGWSEQFNREGWNEALAEAGLDPAFYTTRKREPGEPLPWDHLDGGVDRDWLLAERGRALAGGITADCREAGCLESCGVCDHRTVKPQLQSGAEIADYSPPVQKPEPEVYFLYRVRYSRKGDLKFIGQLEVTRLFGRLIRRSGLPVRYSQGFHPLPRIMFGPPPPVGVESEAEYIDLELTRRLSAEEVGESIGSSCPPGMAVISVREISARSPSVTAVIAGYDYEVISPEGGAVFSEDAARAFAEREEAVISQKRQKGDREIDLKGLVKDLKVESPSKLTLGIRMSGGPSVKPLEAVAAVFGLSEEAVKALEVRRIGAWLKEAAPVRYAGGGDRKAKRNGRR